MDDKQFYKITGKQADLHLFLWMLTYLVFFVGLSFYKGPQWELITFLVTLMIVILSLRSYKGPFRGQAIIEIGEKEIIFRDPFYLPLKVRTFALTEVKCIRIVGPKQQRRVQVLLKNGEIQEVYRILGAKRTKLLLEFLTNRLPATIPIVEKEPPGILSSIRGDF